MAAAAAADGGGALSAGARHREGHASSSDGVHKGRFAGGCGERHPVGRAPLGGGEGRQGWGRGMHVPGGSKEEGELPQRRGPRSQAGLYLSLGSAGTFVIRSQRVLARTLRTAGWRETRVTPWKAVWQLLKNIVTA